LRKSSLTPSQLLRSWLLVTVSVTSQLASVFDLVSLLGSLGMRANPCLPASLRSLSDMRAEADQVINDRDFRVDSASNELACPLTGLGPGVCQAAFRHRLIALAP